MSEERRFFLRTATFATGIAVLYWFVSYEAAGSAMLLAIGLTALFLTFVLRRHTNEPRRGSLETARAIVTFEDPDEAAPAPLAIEDAPMPATSYPPLVVALGAGAVAGGLVFGAWLWLPGAAVLAGAGLRWFGELNRA